MCDTMVAPGNVTAEGHALLAKNSDREPNEAQALVQFPRARHAPGSTVKCTYLEIPQVEETYGVLLSRPFWIWGAEMGCNEFGVAIGNETVFSKAPASKEPGLIGMDLAKEVSCLQRYDWDETLWEWPAGHGRQDAPRHHVVAVDYGLGNHRPGRGKC